MEAKPQAYLDLLPKVAWSAQRLAQMSEELSLGERQLIDNPADLERVRHVLGMPGLADTSKALRPDAVIASSPASMIPSKKAGQIKVIPSVEEVTPITTQTNRQRGIGRRKPRRDPIGKNAEATTPPEVQ